MKLRIVRLVSPAYLALALGIGLAALAGAGCTPSIGDKCVLSTDCSIRGDRLCDTAQKDGYCTIFNCGPNSCPDDAACVLFNASLQGCSYDDRAVSRTARSFCMAHCSTDSDCRTNSGYKCLDPRGAPWSALILDDDQSKRVCIMDPNRDSNISRAPKSDAPVCQAGLPDSGSNAVDSGAGDSAAADSGSDAGSPVDAGSDATLSDAGDAGVTDASDAAAD
jgi:hypothetical protein